ncbi:MAG TPA: serine hydrolase domain-containing protein [Verrucomicrobiales bacterium]|nr:serine hydrolase domain-containing protein [Verrucomicrobiales bacterium]
MKSNLSFSRGSVSAAGLLVAGSLAVPASTWAAEKPGPVIPEAREALEKAVEGREVAGGVTLAGDADGVLHQHSAGWASLENNRAMSADAIFWIASMTKPVTGAAVLMMQEEGKLAVEDPVSQYLPEFAGLKDGEGKPVSVSIAQLLTHTSGLSELSPEESARIRTLAELTPLAAAKPAQFPPGSKWVYCQSSINTAGRIVEVVSGRTFPEFLEERLFGPLGMKDTGFYLNESQMKRLATSYRRTDGGTLEGAEIFLLHGKSPVSRERCPMPNGGLFSTAEDYGRFCRMIVREGELDGRLYLKPESVREMTRIHTGDLVTGFTPGNGWGLGWCVVREPQGASEALSPGSFGHGGAYGTQAWIDPVKGRFYVLMVQRANFPNADASELRRAFQNGAAARLDQE